MTNYLLNTNSLWRPSILKTRLVFAEGVLCKAGVPTYMYNTCIPLPCLSFTCTLFVMIGNSGFISICHQLSPTVWANQLLLFLGSCHSNGQCSNVRTKPVLLHLTDHHCEYELYSVCVCWCWCYMYIPRDKYVCV